MKLTSQLRCRGRGEGLNHGEVQKQAHFRRWRGHREKDEKEVGKGEEAKEEKRETVVDRTFNQRRNRIRCLGAKLSKTIHSLVHEKSVS